MCVVNAEVLEIEPDLLALGVPLSPKQESDRFVCVLKVVREFTLGLSLKVFELLYTGELKHLVVALGEHRDHFVVI